MIATRQHLAQALGPRGVDFTVANHGSIFLLTPRTPAAFAWVEAHIPDDAQTLGLSIAIEHRFIVDLVEGILGDGLVVA
jgi:hypothetical protein